MATSRVRRSFTAKFNLKQVKLSRENEDANCQLAARYTCAFRKTGNVFMSRLRSAQARVTSEVNELQRDSKIHVYYGGLV